MKIFITFLILSVFGSIFGSISMAQELNVGDKIPEFTFVDIEGRQHHISEYSGKIIQINFFATWCPPCRKELPHIQKEIWDVYKDDPNFVMLTFGREHTTKELIDFKTQNGFRIPFSPDPERKVFSLFADQSIPRTFLINKDGKIIQSNIGFKTKDFNLLKKNIKKELE